MGSEYANTVTKGIISAKSRTLKSGTDGTLTSVIQTDAAINSGNSGGALVNSEGKVIGINTLKLSGTGIEGMGFAIPINSTTDITSQLIQYSKVKRPYIGITGMDLDEQTANWDILQAQNAADAWIEKFGDKIEFIFSNNDAMALGALKSIQKQGYNIGDAAKFIPIVGVDAIPEVIEEIKKGTVVGTVLQSPKDQAKAIVDMLLNVANKKDVLDGTEYKLDDVKAVRVPYRAITLENIEESAEAYK